MCCRLRSSSARPPARTGGCSRSSGSLRSSSGNLKKHGAFSSKWSSSLRNIRSADFPPTTATTLAKLYEADGRLDRAADLYRALSQGSDRDRHALYHYEAGRLLEALGLDEEARRMLTRAEALLGEDDGELGEKVAALLRA